MTSFAASKNLSAFSNFENRNANFENSNANFENSNARIIKKSTALLLAADGLGVSECFWLSQGKATWQTAEEGLSSFKFLR